MFTAAGKSAAVSAANYIEDVFSTYLYTGTGSTQTITNGIDLSGKGGLVWVKNRAAAVSHVLLDTVRGSANYLSSNTTDSQQSIGTLFSSFNNNGFTVGADNGSELLNGNTKTYVSWTFRKQAKFFDVVTYTGNGVAGRTVAHNLGSVPGCMIIKRTDTTGNWGVYHRGIANTENLFLNTTGAATSGVNYWNSTTPTSTEFTVGTNANVNASGGTYVAYLFAHNAGGFGLTGTDNVITCGTYLGSNHRSKEIVTLGYEPQWVMVKNITTTGQRWVMVDNMRGMADTGSQAWLFANSNVAETTTAVDQVVAASTGFFFNGPESDINEAGSTFIYIAIRRGPMKTPTSGTSVFSPVARTGTGSAASITGVGFPPDLVMFGPRSIAENKYEIDRLRGAGEGLITNSTSGGIGLGSLLTLNMGGISMSDGNSAWNQSAATYVNWFFGRAPGFFDVVCYTGTGAATTFNHNLAVVPELMIVKSRNNATNWAVYCAYLGGTNPANRYVLLNSSNSFGGTSVYWNDTAPTSTVFTVGTTAATNTSAYTYVNYLFATCPGVSKVGSYTGTGALQTINCGFASGARFVLIKRTDSTGDWWTYDSARGITSGNDPYLFLNSTAAEVTNTNYVDTAATGFQVTAAAPAGLNANGGTYIFLAIA